MRQIIRNRLDNPVNASSRKAKPIPTKSITFVNCKSKSNSKELNKDSGFTEGVFFKVPSAVSLAYSDSSVDTASSASSRDGGSNRSLSSACNATHATTTTVPAATSWKSTERKSFLLHQPLIVCDPEKIDTEMETDLVAALGKVMARSKKLPSTDYYCSNHILVNDERVQRMIAPLSRMRELDDLARYHAMAMAQSQTLFHTDPNIITDQFHRPVRQMGENVARGKTIKEIHTDMMTKQQQCSDKYNILHRCYTHMGMGTAKGKDGQLYLCQIYRG
jgi:uncharacterized protein YkwD